MQAVTPPSGHFRNFFITFITARIYDGDAAPRIFS